MRTIIYQTLLREVETGDVCVYIGSHRTNDPLWPSPGCSDKYIGSSKLVMSNTKHCTVADLRDGWVWLSTSILEEVSGEEATLAVEGRWIYDAMLVFGIHPLAREIIARKSKNHPLLKIHVGTCLNCHRNSDKFQDTDYYRSWLSKQGIRSALGNSRESREKALLTRMKHVDEIRRSQSERMAKYTETEEWKSQITKLSCAGNSKDARLKANETRYSHMDQWVCLDRVDIKMCPLRVLGEKMDIGRGPQQCWSRLGKPDMFIFKGLTFKLVRKLKTSSSEK